MYHISPNCTALEGSRHLHPSLCFFFLFAWSVSAVADVCGLSVQFSD